jgi:sterol desaturase/sphingolipid hydroxylase (fatty acid hydroxylase superfamily)
MDLIAYAGPFFAVFILAELLLDWRRGTGYYRLNDAVGSLSMGILSTASKLVIYGMEALILLWTGEHLALWQVPGDSVLAWVLVFIFYDMLYYWFHRISHERQLFWGAHVAHHSSEEYNLTTALRQTSMGFFYSWIFFIPCFVLGVPAEMYFTVAAVNLLYQFWVHTRHINKLGWFDYVFVSPSNHRVHHARNSCYMDRNYGGVFILWDRLFGTFVEELEEEPVEFGITKPLNSFNPLRANLHIFLDMWRDCLATHNRADKWKIWFSRTGWRPSDLPENTATAMSEKFDPPCTRLASLFALGLLVCMYIWGSYYIFAFQELAYVDRAAGFAVLLLTLMEAGAVLENRASAVTNLARRALLLAAVAYLWQASSGAVAWFYPAYGVLLVSFWVVLKRPQLNDVLQVS